MTPAINVSFFKKIKADLALLGAGLFFGVSSPLARVMGLWLNPFSVVFVRNLCALPFSILFLRKTNFKNVPVKKLIPFGLLLPTSVCLYTFALFNTKVSLAIFSFYLSNLISAVMVGYIFNSEKFSKNKAIAFCLSLGAVIIFTRPFGDLNADFGIIFGYLSGIIATVASFYQKRLARAIDPKILAFTQVLGGIFISATAIFLVKDFSIFSLSINGVWLSFLFGFIFFLINYLMIYGFKHTEIGIGTILLSSELVFGPIAAYFIFRETLTLWEIIGGLLIVMATIFISKHKDI